MNAAVLLVLALLVPMSFAQQQSEKRLTPVGPGTNGAKEFRDSVTKQVFVLIPKGKAFVPYLHKLRQGRIEVPGFFISKSEISEAALSAFLKQTGLRRAKRPKLWTAHADYPAEAVPLSEAARCARWLGGRLPCDAEWQRAARGELGTMYACGTTIRASSTNWAGYWIGRDTGAPSIRLKNRLQKIITDRLFNGTPCTIACESQQTGDTSHFGVRFMTGNLEEWLEPIPQVSEADPQTHQRWVPGASLERWRTGLRGCKYDSTPRPLVVRPKRVSSKEAETPTLGVGFRVVLPLEAARWTTDRRTWSSRK